MIGLLPIDEFEKLAILVGLESLEDIIFNDGKEQENTKYIKFKSIIGPLKKKIEKIDFKF